MSIEANRGMLGSLKKFDKSEHDIYDVKAKKAMIKYLDVFYKNKGLAWKVVENPNKYGIDLLVLNEKDEVVRCFELEVRYQNWQGDKKFPFDKINCIERKDYQWRKDPSFIKKIPFKMAQHYDVYYVQLNDECSRAVIIDRSIILQFELKHWPNRKSNNEYVRQVPIEKTTQVSIKIN